MGCMAADVPTPAEAIELKQEPLLDGYTSSSMSSPEAEHEPSAQENLVPPVKRKGGRKPVRVPRWWMARQADDGTRYMPRQKSESKETAKLKQHFENDVQNTSSNSKQQFNGMRKPCIPCNKVIEMQQMNVSCFATRTHCLNESSSRKVGGYPLPADVY